jgi:tryptophan synthase alpha chain
MRKPVDPGIPSATRIPALFRALKAARRTALIPYVTAGFPSRRATPDLLRAAEDGGADLIELGIPFSDPLADGPVIQGTSHRALAGGARVADAFRLAERFAARSRVPLLFMTYYNLLLQRGVAAFVRDSRRAGVAGLIVADLPPDEAGTLRATAEAEALDLTFLCAPTSPPERIRRVCEATTGFVYLVSLRGVTGARAALPPDLGAFVRRVRRETDKPLCVGFGIATPPQARAVGRMADGVIVGSALLRAVAGQPAASAPGAARRFLAAFRAALDRTP